MLATHRLDVLALVRGGGARTDLVAFDDEAVARAIGACPVPVLTGVGHEIDTSVADEAIEALMPLYGALDPDTTGGAMLLGVDGVCIISHGSSSATAIVNAVRVAADMVAAGVVDRLRAAVGTG